MKSINFWNSSGYIDIHIHKKLLINSNFSSFSHLALTFQRLLSIVQGAVIVYSAYFGNLSNTNFTNFFLVYIFVVLNVHIMVILGFSIIRIFYKKYCGKD